MNKISNIAIVGLGQIGLYLYNELKTQTKIIQKKTGKTIKIVGISAKNRADSDIHPKPMLLRPSPPYISCRTNAPNPIARIIPRSIVR